MNAPRPLTERLREQADTHARILGPGFGNCFYGSGMDVRLFRAAADRIEALETLCADLIEWTALRQKIWEREDLSEYEWGEKLLERFDALAARGAARG